MQLLASSKGRVPNVLGVLIANFGTLVVHAPDGRWYYFGKEWLPADGFTDREFIRIFHAAPPTNVPIEWWGLVTGMTDETMCRDCEWTSAEIAAALDSFVEMFTGGGIHPRVEGRTIRHLSKAKHLATKQGQEWDRLITPAPDPSKVHPRRIVRTKEILSNVK